MCRARPLGLLLVLLLSCHSSDKAASAVASASAPCLKHKLPRAFSRERYAEVDAALNACLPSSQDALFHSGLSGLRFGRDTRTGLALELRVSCGDLCPQYTLSVSGPRVSVFGGVDGSDGYRPAARSGALHQLAALTTADR